jgi:coproporphyrinogen III oxidase
VTDERRAELAQLVRGHYRAHPEALSMQATGDIVPPTVDNHLAPR